MADSESRLTYTVDETSELLGIGRAQAYAAVRNGQIPSVRIGKRVLVPRVALERLLQPEVQTAGQQMFRAAG